MKFQFLPENFSRSENAPPFETRKIRLFEVERIFLKNKKMLEHFDCLPPYRGGVANQAVQLVGVEGFPDEFRVVDEVLDFGLHGMYPFS